MKDFPQAFWAVMLALIGAALAVVVLFNGSPENIKLGVLGVASSLVTGALGYIGGHAIGKLSQTKEGSTE